jgi:septum formation protein
VRLILASRSPRRKALLVAAGYEVEVEAADVDERQLPGEDVVEYVLRLAAAKVQAVAAREPGSVVLGADTAVVVEGLVLGKPVDDDDAAAMLRRLSGREHVVVTGVAVRDGDRTLLEVSRTCVWFVPLSPGEIAWYVQSGEPRDKAGAYAIQGLASRFVERIQGSYTNVVGLPMATVHQLLGRLGHTVDLAPSPAIS